MLSAMQLAVQAGMHELNIIVVRDKAQRRQLGAVYRKASDEVGAIYAAGGRPAHLTERRFRLLMEGGAYFVGASGRCPRVVGAVFEGTGHAGA